MPAIELGKPATLHDRRPVRGALLLMAGWGEQRFSLANVPGFVAFCCPSTASAPPGPGLRDAAQHAL